MTLQAATRDFFWCSKPALSLVLRTDYFGKRVIRKAGTNGVKGYFGDTL